jgi:transcriptional regulator with XRE-family HTH domain
MAKKTAPLLPSTDALLRQFSDRLRLARLRRRLPAKQVAEAAGMSPMTLRSLERGGSGVTIGAYLAVMQVLGIEDDLDLLAQADPVGRQLQDARLPASRPVARAQPKTAPLRQHGADPAADELRSYGASSTQCRKISGVACLNRSTKPRQPACAEIRLLKVKPGKRRNRMLLRSPRRHRRRPLIGWMRRQVTSKCW